VALTVGRGRSAVRHWFRSGAWQVFSAVLAGVKQGLDIEKAHCDGHHILNNGAVPLLQAAV